jgi:hypothetical protein
LFSASVNRDLRAHAGVPLDDTQSCVTCQKIRAGVTRSHNTPRPDPVRPHIASEMSALASASSVFTGAYPRGSRTIGNPRRGRANPTAGRSRQTTASDSRARVSSATTPLTVSPSLPPFPTGRSVRVAAPKRTVARASRVAATAKLEAGDKVKVRTDVHSPLLVINHHRQINHRNCQNRSDRSSANQISPSLHVFPASIDPSIAGDFQVCRVPRPQG